MSNSKDLNNPYKKNNFLVFPDTVLEPISVNDCNDSLNSVCYDLNLNDCMEKCSSSNKCSSGMHYKINNKNICAPLSNQRYNERILINPIERLNSKNIYSWLKEVSTNFFVKENINKSKETVFPPNNSAALYAKNIISLKSLDRKWLYLKNFENNALLYATKNINEKSNFEIIPLNSANNLLLPYVPIQYNLPVIIRIPGTNLTLTYKNKEKKLYFVFETTNPINLNNSENKNIKYKLVKYEQPNYTGDVLKDDFYYIKTLDGENITINDNEVYLNNKGTIFTHISQIKVYYCNNNNCDEIEWDKTIVKGNNLYYGLSKNKISRVYLKHNCYGLCKNKLYNQNNQNNQNNQTMDGLNIVIIILFLLISIIIIVLVSLQLS
tara:strand:+ start:12542 stop:13681 length:1140 start_codon:yes stop_codon:yes gene_type:complete